MTTEYNYIIVGQGLAGTCLSYELIKKGNNVLVIDSSDLPSSSLVAGGLFNPVTGRKMVLTWKAHDIFPFLISFYRELERFLSKKFVYQSHIFKPFLSVEEQNEWQARSSHINYKDFIKDVNLRPQYVNDIVNPLGGVFLQQTGYLNTKTMLDRYRAYLRSEEKLLDEKFIYEDLNINGKKIVYKEHSADKLIFCDGPQGFGNRIFESIKFQPLKGEVLQLEMKGTLEVIVNRNGFVVPQGDSFIAGSNYRPGESDWEVTKEAREEIVEKISKLLVREFNIVHQRAGVRPTTHDRRPVIGIHPDLPSIGIFNGLGTKGVSLAPYFASQFANHLQEGSKIDSEVRIGRYFD